MPTNAWGLYYPIMAMAGRGYQNRITTMGDPDVTYLGQTGKARPAQLLTYHSFIGLYGGFAMTSDHLYKPEFGGEQSVRMMEQLYPVSREAGHGRIRYLRTGIRLCCGPSLWPQYRSHPVESAT